MVWVGGVALLSATLTDVLSVIGRHIGVPLHGAIELIQPAILIAGTLAIVAATVTACHAQIHLLVDRLPLGWRSWADRFAIIMTIAFFAPLLAGSIWIAIDMWGTHEQSELVRVPWRWLRVIANLGMIATILVLARQLATRGAR